MPVTVLVINPDNDSKGWMVPAFAPTDYVVEYVEEREALLRRLPLPPATCLVAFAEPDADATLQLVREVRRCSADTPVIVLGPHTAFRTAVDIARLPGTDFLELPVTSRQLRVAIARALKGLTR